MNLIVQGHEVATPDLKQLAKLSGASAIEAINPQAFRLRNASMHADIASYCENAQLDFGLVEAGRTLNSFGLAVMDMDSTLITIECIDEIADMQGLKPEVAAITAAAMRGELDFTQSLQSRVALLKGLDMRELERVYDERLKLSPGADAMLSAFKKHGIKTLLVSGGFTFFTDRLKLRLKLDYARSNTLDIANGKLTGKVLGNVIDADAKRATLIEIRDQLGLKPEQVMALGDGANDLKFMAEAGASIAYHAKPVVRAQASYALNFVGLDGVINLFAG